MPSLADHHSSNIVKMIFVGDSGAGKTGALVSLVEAGYKLRIVDTDNGVDILRYLVLNKCPDKIGNVSYVTARDAYSINAAGQLSTKGQPKAFAKAMKLTEDWEDGTKPREWGPDYIYILDTLGTLGKAAEAWAQGMNPGAKDPRQWFFTAQTAIEHYIMSLTADDFRTNLIVISHLSEGPKEQIIKKLYPSTIGRALGPSIPKHFNNFILAESMGEGKNVKRVLRTVPNGTVELKTSAPFQLEGTLPQESGLATIFKTLKG